MADSSVEVTSGTGTSIDTRTEATNGNHRQVVVLGDPATNAGVAPVDATAGLKVNLGSDNDVTLAVLPDTAAGDLAAINTAVSGTLTVSGTVTSNLSATDNAVLDTIDAMLDTINAKLVTGTVIGDVNLGATDNAVLDTIASNTGSVKTAVELIDNAISGSEMQVDIVASLPAGTNAIGKLSANSGVDIGDVDVKSTSIDKSINGAGAPTVDSYANAAISASANTANQSLIAAPGASKQIWVYGIEFTVGTGDGSVSFQDEDDTAISGVMPFSQNSGMAISPSGNFAMPLWKVATNKALEVDTVTSDIKGSIQYAIISV